MWCWICRQADYRAYGVMEASIKISKEGLGGQTIGQGPNLYGEPLRGQGVWSCGSEAEAMETLEFRDSRGMEYCQGKLQMVEKPSQLGGHVGYNWQGHRDRAVQVLCSSYFTTMPDVEYQNLLFAQLGFRLVCIQAFILFHQLREVFEMGIFVLCNSILMACNLLFECYSCSEIRLCPRSQRTHWIQISENYWNC